ncbi:MAG: YkgJ family cysteine cluster protein [Thermodesulfobacteriota bacterium]
MTPRPPHPVFQCQQCGDCCQGNGGILLSQKEMRRLAAFLKMSLKDFRQRYVTASSLGPNLATQNGICIFQEGKLCRVHPVKPRICREWPYLPALLKYAEEFEEAKRACPGIDPECSHTDFVAAAREISGSGGGG